MYNQEWTDDILLSRLKEDDSDAFETIYRRYWRELFAFVYQQIGSREDTQEIIQELMLSLWQKRFDSQIYNLRPYLFIAARNQVNMYFRREINLRKYKEYQVLQEVYENRGSDEIVSEKQLSDAIEKALEKLPGKTANIFRLNKLDNVSVKKIASQMGLSDRAVEYHLTKSMRVVRKHLQHFLTNN